MIPTVMVGLVVITVVMLQPLVVVMAAVAVEP